MKLIAAVRIRGGNRTREVIERTLNQLHLYRKNFCTVIPDTSSYRGMLAKVKDYITYGPIDETFHKTLIEKRGEKAGDGCKPFFRLHPPRGGFERKGTKKAYTIGGTLGFRGEEIKKLLARML